MGGEGRRGDGSGGEEMGVEEGRWEWRRGEGRGGDGSGGKGRGGEGIEERDSYQMYVHTSRSFFFFFFSFFFHIGNSNQSSIRMTHVHSRWQQVSDLLTRTDYDETHLGLTTSDRQLSQLYLGARMCVCDMSVMNYFLKIN